MLYEVITNPCSGVCYKGTELEEAFELLEKADGVIFGSPVYFGTVSAQMKAFADKARGLRGKNRITSYNVCYTKLLRAFIPLPFIFIYGTPCLPSPVEN